MQTGSETLLNLARKAACFCATALADSLCQHIDQTVKVLAILNALQLVQTWREAKKNTPSRPKAKPGRPKKDAPKKDTTANEIKNSKIALGKSTSNLTPNQQAKVEWIAKTEPRLYRAYKLKEALRLVFYNDTVEEAEEALTAWVKWARHCRIPAFVELQRKIVRHFQHP